MQIDFIDAESFLEEVELRANANDIGERIVRVQRETQSSNAALSVSTVRAGFLTLAGDLIQFVDVCGKDPPPRGETAGSETAKIMEAMLRERVSALGIEVRKGQFVG